MIEQHPSTADIRSRLEEIAAEINIAAEPDEPLERLVPRIRAAVSDEFQLIADHYDDLQAELDEFEELVAEDTAQEDEAADEAEDAPPAT
jgi:hypothetical protein